MNKNKFIVGIIGILFLISVILISCPLDDPSFGDCIICGSIPCECAAVCTVCGVKPCNCGTEPPVRIPFDPPVSGTGYGYGAGFARSEYYYEQIGGGAFGAYIRADLTVVDGLITQLSWIGPDESPEFFYAVYDRMRPLFYLYNSFDLASHYVHAISGASDSFNGMREAALNALEMITEAWLAAQALTISFDKEIVFLPALGGPETLNVTYTPAHGVLSWTSSAPGIATVDNDGEVTALAPGMTVITATITVTDTDTGATESLSANVLVVVF